MEDTSTLSGKMVASIAVTECNVDLKFTDGSKLSIGVRFTGGDYNSPYLDCELNAPKPLRE